MKRLLRSWLWHVPVEQEVDEELDFHVDMRTRALIERGMDPDLARETALRRLGDVRRLKRTCVDLGRKRDREMRLTQWLEEFRSDVRFAVRQLRRAPAFALVSAITLALGIGANSAMFALVDATLLRPLPFVEPDRLVQVWERFGQASRARVASLNFRDWNERNQTFESMAGFFAFPRTMIGADGTAEQIWGQQVTSRFFDVLGVKAIAGRTFLPTDVASPPNVVVLSEGLWRTRFGADPTMVGRVIRLDEQPFTVLGIVPAGFQLAGPAPTGLWTVWTELPGMDARALHFLVTVGRLKRGVTVDAARGDMAAVADSLAAEFPTTNKGRSVTIDLLRDGVIGREVRQTSLLFLGVVGFVLLMCCATVANLLMARTTGRARELAIRSAIGAGRRRIFAQVLTESLVLAAFGGAMGLVVGAAILNVAPSMIPAGLLPTELTVAFDQRVVAFCAGTALLTGVLFGLAPAWQATRSSLVQALSAEGRTTTRSGRLRSLLVVGEVAAAVMLLCGAGLLLRTLMVLDGVEPGYRAKSVLTMQVSLPYGLPISRYKSEAQIRRFQDDVEREVNALPGVRSVGWVSALPLDREFYGTNSFQIVGDPPRELSDRPLTDYQIVSPTYLDTLDIPIVAGRGLTVRDTAESTPVCLVNEAFARRYLHGRAALGTRVAVQPQTLGPATPVVREIVGVVRQVKGRPDETEDPVQVYVPIAQNAWSFTSLVVRPANGPAEALTTAVRQAVARVDDQVPLTRIRTLDDVAQEATARPRFRAVLVMTFAGLALLLAMVGVFGILAYAVQQRSREFGVRIALGATRSDVLNLVVRSAARVIAAGLIVGLGLAAALGRSLATMLFGVQPLDVVTFASAALVLALTAAAATVAPAWRAARTDPIVALRSE
jgi:putative ABC transport system permease protein